MNRLMRKSTLALLLVGWLAAGVCGQTSPAGTLPLEIEQTLNPERIYVKGLGNEPQETEVTLSLMAPTGERLPTDLLIAVDTSATVNLSQMTAIGVAILDQAGSQDRVGLVSFATNSKLEVPLTHDRRAVEDGLKKLRNIGRTAIGEGIFTAVNELLEMGRADANWAVILLTDGRSNTGRAPLTQAQRAFDNGVKIFTIGVGRSVDRAVMSEIARITRGEFFEKFEDSVPRSIFRSFDRAILARTLRIVQILPAELTYESATENPPGKVTQNANKTTTLEWNIDELKYSEEWRSVFTLSGSKEGTYPLNAKTSKVSYLDSRGRKIERDLPNTFLRVRSINRPPTASFDFTPSAPSAEDEISFIDQSSDPDGSIVSWSWDFGDGSSSNQASPTHKYAQDGTYTVTLTVTDIDDLTNIKTRAVKVETLKVSVRREITTYLPSDETLPQQSFMVTLTIQINQRLLGLGIEENMPEDKWEFKEKDNSTAHYRKDSGTRNQWLFREELTPGTVKTIVYEVKLAKDARSGKISGRASSAFPAFETLIMGEAPIRIVEKLPFRVLLSRWDPSKTQTGSVSTEVNDEPIELNLKLAAEKLTQEQILAVVSWWSAPSDRPLFPEYFKRRAKETLSLQLMQELIAYWLTDTAVFESLPPFK